jgi:cell division septation protein DedD
MASGGRRGAGERVLESRHVIGLFLLMLLFSGIFFTLGYKMGTDQYGGKVRAADDFQPKSGSHPSAKVDPALAKPDGSTSEGPAGSPAAASSDWDFYHARDRKSPNEKLKPASPSPTPVKAKQPAAVKEIGEPKAPGTQPKAASGPLIPAGSYSLQVAAVTKESDALDLAAQLRKKRFQAYVLPARTDKYFRVQVGPFADRKAADSARKGLEGAGFKAIVKH